MPNRWVRDANNNLAPKVTVGGLPDGTVVNADIASASIQAGKLDYFHSTEITGTGAEASTAHGLGRTPALVIVYATENTTGNTLDIAEGTHDGTDIKVNAPSTCKYKIFAI